MAIIVDSIKPMKIQKKKKTNNKRFKTNKQF